MSYTKGEWMKKLLVEYNSNNSGGGWWLKDKDWKKLEKAGWFIVWATKSYDYSKKGGLQYTKNGFPKLKNEADSFCSGDRWLGALARSAYKHFDAIKDALEEFEKITKQTVSDKGCNCCGAPHSFSWENARTHRRIDYCSGEDCLKYMYSHVPRNLREACKALNKKGDKHG